jgi:glucose-6-phosphate isomerase
MAPDARGLLGRLLRKDTALWADDHEVRAKIADRLGWLDVHARMLDRVPELEAFAEEVRERGYTHAVLLGMGGSSLAPEMFQLTFGNAAGCPELIVLDTTDPAQILAAERRLDLEHTLFVVSSKSGTTIETLSLLHYFADRVRGATGDDVLDNFVAITDPGTPLEKLAQNEGFWRTFAGEPDIGGRYSALSVFGLVPAAVIGVDTGRLLERANSVDPLAGVELGLEFEEYMYQKADKFTIIASPGVASFGAWAEQLLAESTGKQGTGIVPVAGEPLGQPDEYADDRIFIRLRTGDADDGLDVPLASLASAGHVVVRRDLADAYDLGGELVTWMTATAIVGSRLGINPFNEPNVREAKDATTAVLKESFRGDHVPDPRPIKQADGMALYAEGHTIGLIGHAETPAGAEPIELLMQARLTRARDYLAMLAFIERSEEHDELLARIRVAMRRRLGVATTSGYGPRYLHSTGQLHKGGPDSGVFLQLTADDAEDIPIPGESYTFGTLKRAQALGDLRSLQSRARRVARLHLGRDATAGLRMLAEAAEASSSEARR